MRGEIVELNNVSLEKIDTKYVLKKVVAINADF